MAQPTYDLHRLRLLRELKHRGTLAAVAEALAYSPSTVSQQLSQLAAEVGVPLLEPAGRRVRLTEQAEILVRHTEAVLEQLERAESEVAASQASLTGAIRIAAFQTATLSIVPGALTLLRERHSGLRVHVAQMEPDAALPGLAIREFDLVVGEAYPGDRWPGSGGLDVQALVDDPLRLGVARSAGAGRAPAWPQGVETAPWVMEPARTPARRWAEALCRSAGFVPDVRFETTDLLLHVRLIEEGHAVGFLPDLVWFSGRPTVALGRLPAGQDARRIFTAVRSGSGAHPSIAAARLALKDAAPPRRRNTRR